MIKATQFAERGNLTIVLRIVDPFASARLLINSVMP